MTRLTCFCFSIVWLLVLGGTGGLRPAISKIVLSNRSQGPDIILQIAEDRAPNGFDSIENVISQQELDEIASRYKKTARFSIKQVNQQ